MLMKPLTPSLSYVGLPKNEQIIRSVLNDIDLISKPEKVLEGKGAWRPILLQTRYKIPRQTRLRRPSKQEVEHSKSKHVGPLNEIH